MVFHLVEQMMEKFIKDLWWNDENYGNGTAQRTCAAADRTGHAILPLYGQALKHNTEFYRILCIRQPMKNGECKGVIA